MSLLDRQAKSGHITEALVHFNHAIGMSTDRASKVGMARTLFDGLNKLQTEWIVDQADQNLGEVKAFQTMILSELRPIATDSLVRSPELRSLVMLNPKVMDHDVLRDGGYRPHVAIDETLSRKATKIHRKLEKAYRELDANGGEAHDRAIKCVAELLYIIRSNIAHGEKTPYGPDLEKRERDEKVCTCVVPLQELLIDMILDHPSRKLVSYGTLAPGQANHAVTSDLKGEWEECIIQGTINQHDGLPRFSWKLDGSVQVAKLFTSDDLPNHWGRLDQFEGNEYRRQLIPAKTKVGIEIGYAYIAAEGSSD